MNCSIIIRCLNEERHLPLLLDSLERQTLRPAEVIIVDSGSADDTVQIARSKGACIVQIPPSEFSFGRALNVGASAASGEVIVIASAHTYPATDRWLEILTRPFIDPEVALAYGAQTGDHRSKFSEIQLFKQWFPSQPSENQTHSFCNNANAAVRRSAWQDMPYDEQIPALEDIHWAKRAIERRLKIAYQPEAKVVHVHEESYRKIYGRYRREGMALGMILPWERMNLLQAIGLTIHAIRSDLREAFAQSIASKVFASVIRFRVAQYWGTYRGLNWHGSLTGEVRARLYYPEGYQKTNPALSDKEGSSTLTTVAPEKRGD